VLAAERSAKLREQLVVEIRNLAEGDDLALWAHRRLAAKNTLTAADAGIVEATYQAALDAIGHDAEDLLDPDAAAPATLSDPQSRDGADRAGQAPQAADQAVSPIHKENRRRNKAHLAFVAAQPCLLCQRSPCDAFGLTDHLVARGDMGGDDCGKTSSCTNHTWLQN
jgi:hypothetical protein